MRKVVLYIGMSLDGYIADREGGVDWMRGDGSEIGNTGSYPDFFESVDTVILGYNTYRQIVDELSPDRWMYAGKTSYVLTHRTLPAEKEIVFTDLSPAALISEIRSVDGKDIWVCGGAETADEFIANDLVDRFCISVIPTVLGGGIRLFDGIEREKKLSFLLARQYDGIVDLVYERRK